MAIYSLSMSAVGRATHTPGTAGAHVAYITRASATRAVLAERMPAPRIGKRGDIARAWLDAQEAQDRKNARVITKLMVALPHELEPEAQAQLVREFCETLTQERAPWLAAIHAPSQREGADERNWHAHIVVRDRDPETGKRVCGLSEKGSADTARRLWQDICNAALARAGVSTRIDHRSLRAQGSERTPEIHVGPKATAMAARGRQPESRDRIVDGREVRWTEIDQGQTRAERRAEIVLERELDHERTRIADLVDAARNAEQTHRSLGDQGRRDRERVEQVLRGTNEAICNAKRELAANGPHYERIIAYVCGKIGQYLAAVIARHPAEMLRSIVKVKSNDIER